MKNTLRETFVAVATFRPLSYINEANFVPLLFLTSHILVRPQTPPNSLSIFHTTWIRRCPTGVVANWVFRRYYVILIGTVLCNLLSMAFQNCQVVLLSILNTMTLFLYSSVKWVILIGEVNYIHQWSELYSPVKWIIFISEVNYIHPWSELYSSGKLIVFIREVNYIHQWSELFHPWSELYSSVK
jgi:hypothetical protein